MSSDGLVWGCCGLPTADDYIQCKKCMKAFHLACLTSSSGSSDLVAPPWICPACTNQLPKGGNGDEIPVGFSPNVTTRPTKRQALESPPGNGSDLASKEDLRCVVREVVRGEIEGLAVKISNSLKLVLNSELKTVSAEIKDMKDSMNFMNTKFEEMLREQNEAKAIIADLKAENASLTSTVKDLSARLNSIEQNARSKNVEIQCVPEKKNENVIEIVTKISKVINCNVSSENIASCTRIAKLNPGHPRPRSIVAQFSTIQTRDKFMAAVINYNKQKPLHDKLNSANLDIDGPKTPIYVVDHLSPANKALHAAARTAAKQKGYKHVWVRSGRIYMRKSDDSNYILVKDMDTVKNLV